MKKGNSSDEYKKVSISMRKVTEDADIRKAIEDADSLFKELCRNNPDLFKDRPMNKMSVRQALASDCPLENIRNEMGEKDIQKLFSLLYAAIMEVYSAGAGILFDRYGKEEIETIYNNYRVFGAELFCNAIDSMRNFIKEKLGETYSEDDYFDLCDTDEYAKLDRKITLQYEEMGKEMEAALTEFAIRNLESLENK